MRAKFINNLGGIMLVDESRIEEYKEAGYKLASDSVSKAVPAEKEKSTTKKKVVKEV